MTHYPMSAEQRLEFENSLETITERLEEMVSLMQACYGEQDARTLRSDEVRGAMQRFRWALEREAQIDESSRGGPAHFTARVRATAASVSES